MTTAVSIVLLVPLACYLGVMMWSWLRYDEPRIVTYEKPEQALRSLIDDLKLARKSALVIAEKCKLDKAPKPLVDELISVLRDRHQAGVQISLEVYATPPEQLGELRREGAVSITMLAAPPPYAARIIDRKRVTRFLGKDSELYPAGTYLEADRAPGIAFNLAAHLT
ncbi:MAG: hypothetical protein WA005_16725 [Candidatus Binataceae bacterium]